MEPPLPLLPLLELLELLLDAASSAAAFSAAAFAAAAASASWRAFSAASSSAFFATAASRPPRSSATRWSTAAVAAVTSSARFGRKVSGRADAASRRSVAFSSAEVSTTAGWPMSRPEEAMSFCTEATACIEVDAAVVAARASWTSGPRAAERAVGVVADASENVAVDRSAGEAVAAGTVPVRAAAATTPSTRALAVVTGRRRERRAAWRRERRLVRDVESERIEPVSREGGRCGCHRPTRVRRARNPEPGTPIWTGPGRRAFRLARKAPIRGESSAVRAARARVSRGRPTPRGRRRSGMVAPAVCAVAMACARLECHSWGSVRSSVGPVTSHEHIRFASTRGMRSPSGVRMPTAPVRRTDGRRSRSPTPTQLGQPTT